MRLRTRALAITAVAGVIAVSAGLLVGLVGGASAQTPPTATPAASVGGPVGVPSARFFGTVSGIGGAAVANGTTVTASVGGVACGTGTVTSGSYSVDVQAIAGCTTAGATVNFAIGGQPATQTGTLPNIPGTAVNLNLTVAAPTPSPTPSPTQAPPPPPPPPPATATPRPPAPTPTAVIPVAPPNTGLGGTSQQKPSGAAAPVTQKPAAAQVTGATPALPNTGAGASAFGGQEQPLLVWLLVASLISLVGAGTLSLRARRR